MLGVVAAPAPTLALVLQPLSIPTFLEPSPQPLALIPTPPPSSPPLSQPPQPSQG